MGGLTREGRFLTLVLDGLLLGGVTRSSLGLLGGGGAGRASLGRLVLVLVSLLLLDASAGALLGRATIDSSGGSSLLGTCLLGSGLAVTISGSRCLVWLAGDVVLLEQSLVALLAVVVFWVR